ncbi:hypothetical protein Leryth_016271 [Lithospermum erythrorhizon]|nr:hypothetical protein Leryth_016271 [Lithospermum erythrorhizon]
MLLAVLFCWTTIQVYLSLSMTSPNQWIRSVSRTLNRRHLSVKIQDSASCCPLQWADELFTEERVERYNIHKAEYHRFSLYQNTCSGYSFEF